MIIENLLVLWKWRYFIISLTIFSCLSAILIAYNIPSEFKSKSVILSISSKANEFNQLSSFNNSAIARALGSKLFGVAKTNEDIILGILKSNYFKKIIIDHFNLNKYYKCKNIEGTIRKFENDLSVTPNEFGMIEISILNRDPSVAAEVLNFTIAKLDSIFSNYQLKLIKNSRIFLEKKVNEGMIELLAAEDSLANFQLKFGVFDLPIQVKLALEILSQFESQYLNLEIENEILKRSYGLDSYKYQLSSERLSYFKEVLIDFSHNIESNVLNPFIFLPEVYLNFYSLKRSIKNREAIYKSLVPLHEAFKLRENTNVPTIMVLDTAVPSSSHELPRRSFIIISGFFISFFLSLVLVIRGNNILKETEHKNYVDITELAFFNKLKRIFKVI